MKQSDYAIHRPLVEATGNGKELDKVIQNIVDDLPSNPSWDDIQRGFEKASSYEQTKSSWGGGFGKGITANYYHRIAKKLGVEKVWANDGDRPTVISADGRTAMFFDPRDSDKAIAQQLNDKGALSPSARTIYELPPPPEPEVEEPEVEEPEGKQSADGGQAAAKVGSEFGKRFGKKDKPDVELPNVNQRDVTDAAATVSNDETIAKKNCPIYYLDADGELYNVNWNLYDEAENTIATGVALKGLTQAEAEDARAKLRAADCGDGATDQASAEEAVNASLSGLGLLGAAGMVGKKKPPVVDPKAKPKKKPWNWKDGTDGSDGRKGRKGGAAGDGDKTKTRRKMKHGADPWDERRVATGGDGDKPKTRRPVHRGTAFDYNASAEREVRNRQRINNRRRTLSRASSPEDLARRKKADFDRKVANIKTNPYDNAPKADGQQYSTQAQDKRNKLRTDSRANRGRANSKEIALRNQDIKTRRLAGLRGGINVAGGHQGLPGERRPGYDPNYNKWANARSDQFRPRPETNTATKTTNISQKTRVNEPDPETNNWKKHEPGTRPEPKPNSRRFKNLVNFEPEETGVRDGTNNNGKINKKYDWNGELDKSHIDPSNNQYGDSTTGTGDGKVINPGGDGVGSGESPNYADEQPGMENPRSEKTASNVADKAATRAKDMGNWGQGGGQGGASSKGKNPKPKPPPVPSTPGSLISRPVLGGGDPPAITNDEPIKINNPTPNPATPVEPPTLQRPARPEKLQIDLKTKDPLKTLQGIDVNDMPDLPEIKHNQLHNNLIRMLDTAADPPGGSLQNYLDNLKRDLLSRGVNVQALDTMTDLSKLYVEKLNTGKLGSTEISDLKHLTAALMSNNSSYSKWLDSLKDVKIDMETGLPKADARGDLTPANKGPKASEMPSSVKDIDEWKKSGNSFTPTTLEDFLKSQNITKNAIPFELLDPDTVKTSTLLDAFGFPKDTSLASTLTTDAASEALEKLAIGKLPVQNFPLEAIKGSASMWKDKKTLQQFTSAFQGSTLDLDKLDRAIAYAMTINPEIDKLSPKETTYNDPFDKLENSLDNDATAKAIRDRARRQLQDIEAEMNAAETETNAERRAAKKAEIDAKLEKQRADARAALEAEESKLTDAQRKAHEAHIEAIDKLKAQQDISDTLAANQPTNRKVDGGEFGSSYEANLSAAQNAEIAKKQEQLVAMRKHEQALTKLMQDAEASSMQAYEEYKKTMAAEQAAREQYIKDIQQSGAKGREEAAMARRKAAYENEMRNLQTDTNKAAEAYWQSVQNSPNSENLQRSVEKEMRDAKTFPETGTTPAPDGTKSAQQVSQAAADQSVQQVQAAANNAVANSQGIPTNTRQAPTVGDKRMVNGDEYEWRGKQWRNNTTGKIATTAVAQQLNSMSIPGSSPMVGTTQGALNKADIEQQAQSMNGAPGEVNSNDVTSDKAGTQSEMPTTAQGDMDPGPSTVPQSAEEMRPNDTNLDAVPNADHNKMDELVEDSELKNEQLKALDKDVPHGLIDTKTEEKLLAQIDELEQAVKDGKVDKSVLDQAKALQEELQKYEMATPASADDTPIPDKQRRSVTLEFQNKLDTFMDDVAEMSADKFTKRNTLKSTSTGVTPNEIKKNMPESLRNLADTLGLDTVEELKALQDQHDPKSIDKRYNALKNKMMKQMENILTDNVEGSETKRVTQQKLQEYIDANGGTVKAAATSAVEQMKKLAPNQLTGMAEKLAGKALAAKILKGAGKLAVVGVAGAATGGLAIAAQALNIFEWALDGYDIVTILIGTGVMDDPNEVLNHARAEDLKKVDEFMKSDADDEDKKAFVAAMLRYDSVPAWNPKWWFGGLESWNSELFDKIGYDNKWHDTNFVDEWGQTEGVTVSSSSINPETGKPEIREEGITPYNIHKLRVGVDVSKAARTRGDMERFVDRVESIYESWTQGPFVWLAPVDDNKFQMIVASSVKDVRDATSLDDLRGVNQLVTVPIDHGDGRPRMTEQLKFIPGTFENNLQREIRKYISGGGHFLKDNMEEVLQHITDPNDRRAFDKIINGSVNEIVPVTLQVAQYQAEQAERKWNRVKRIEWRDSTQFPKQRADALLFRYNRDIGLGKYETNESINRKLKIIRKMKHLTERLQTYRNAKYFIIGS